MDRSLTPIRRQYLEIKRQVPGAILLFRLGDFYETFDEDAELAARELDIVLTSRNIAKGVRVPMAGIPHHALEGYLAKLIGKGHHVAICEQVGDTPVKGLFPRQVVRIVTPGTVVEPGLLPQDANNYLACLVAGDGPLGIAYADVSTGEFAATQVEAEDLRLAARHELDRLRPSEVLLPESGELPEAWEGHVTRLPDWRFELDRSEEVLNRHFGTARLDGFGLGGKPLAVRAAGAILEYLTQTQSAALKLLTGLHTYSLSEFMALDAATRRNLELTETLRTGEVRGSLLGVIDETLTPMGRRLLRRWIHQPLLDPERIRRRLVQVDGLFQDGLWRAEVRSGLRQLGDLERLTNRASAGAATPRDLVALRELLDRLPPLRQALSRQAQPAIHDIVEALDPCEELARLLQRAIAENPPANLSQPGVIRAGYSDRLDGVLEESRHAREWIASLEAVERRATGIKSLKVGYNKVFGYYLEVTKANSAMVPDRYLRKQTLVNAERYITPEMKEYESLVLTAEERIRQVEAELFGEICREVGARADRLLGTARAVARLDVVAGLAEAASRRGYVRPEVAEADVLEIREGRHPVVEEFLEGRRFVPNDTVLEDGERVRLITGPNMAGKSTYLRQVALICLMAQMGSFVPARSARVGLTDRIFTRIGAQDEIHTGQSTFMVEMVETANILQNATRRSLLVLDEIGRGTSTYDGLSIAWAVVEFIHNHPRLRARTLFATHYHELTHLAQDLPGVRNYNVAVAEEAGGVVFLYKIVPGRADKSYGIHVAELAGLPRPVINRAQEILAQMEEGSQRREAAQRRRARQLALFADGDPVLAELRALDLSGLTPLEALNKLYEWQQRMKSGQ